MHLSFDVGALATYISLENYRSHAAFSLTREGISGIGLLLGVGYYGII